MSRTESFSIPQTLSGKILSNEFMGDTWINQSAMFQSVTLTASTNFLAVESVEVGSATTLEIPATSSLEIRSYLDNASTIRAQNISNPYRFYVNRTAAYTTSAATGTTMPFTNIVSDPSNGFDAVTNFTYTCPVAGFYCFTGNLLFAAGATRIFLSLFKNTVETIRSGDFTAASALNDSAATAAWCGPAVKGDTFKLNYFTQTGIAIDTTGTCNFGGFLVSV